MNMALTREAIIDAYRQRIKEGKRSKLSKRERMALADSFVELLGYCQSEEDCRVLCEAEIALLEEGYPQGSIANQYLPEWRNAIATAIETGQLPKQDLPPNEFGKTYNHWALYHLLYPNDIYRSLKQKTTQGNNRKQDDLKAVRPDRFIATARRLLTGDSFQEWAAGLLALTGRRFSEIVAKGQFGLTAHPYAIAFKGQLKKGVVDIEQEETFLIATLVDNQDIMVALERLRRHPRIVELQNLPPDDINSRLNTSVRHHVKREFQDTGLVPVLQGEKSVSAHNLRGVYGTISIHFFCPATQNPHRFIQAHLGHIIGVQELASRKNAGATEHYFHYVLVGAEGQMLGDRGILLKPFGPLPTTATMAEEPVIEDSSLDQSDESGVAHQIDLLEDGRDREDDNQDRSAETRSTPTTMAISTPQKKTSSKTAPSKTAPSKTAPSTKTVNLQRRSRTSVPTDLMDGLRAIATVKFDLESASTNTEVMEATVRFLKDDTSPKMVTSIDSLGTTMNWFTAEVDRLRGVIEGLETKLQATQAERDDAIHTLEQHQQTVPNSAHELAELRTENQALRGELQQFHQLKQLLGSSNTSPPSGASVGTNAAPASVSTPSPESAPASAPAPEPVLQKRVQHEGMALAAIDKAISRVIHWNDNDERSFDQKWYISVPILQDLLRGSGYTASQPRLKTAMDNRRQEIDDHHAKHGLGRRHNTRHHQLITTVMTL